MMTDTNSTTLRNALAKSIILYVHENELKTSAAAIMCDVGVSRMHKILRGDVENISSDYLANILGKFGYRLTAINGFGDGTEIVLSLDKAEKVLPEIEKPTASYTLNVDEDESGALKADGIKIMAADGSWEASKDGTLRVVDGQVEVDPDAGRVVNDDE